MNISKLTPWFVLVPFLISGLHAQPAAGTLEERLARLEQRIAGIDERLSTPASADALAPTVKEFNELKRQLGWDGKSQLTVVKPNGKETNLAVGGFVQANFEGGTAPDARFTGLNDRFLLRRARLFVSGAFAENMAFKFESDFGNNSISAKSGLAGQLTDAYLAWTKYPAASVRVGQFKTPFGFEQIASDTKIYTIERSLPSDRLTIGRQIGAGVSGELAGKRLSYSVGAYNGTGTNIGSNDSQKFLWAGRVSGVAFDGTLAGQKTKLTSGVNYFTTQDKGAFTGHRFGTGIDAQLVFGPAELQAEFLRNDSHPVTGAASAAQGWALLAKLDVTKKWQGVVRHETYNGNTATAGATTRLWTLGANYLLRGDDLKLSVDYLSGDQPAPAPRGRRFLGRLQVMF